MNGGGCRRIKCGQEARSFYRAGELIVDNRTSLTFDYTKRKGVMHTEIFIPTGVEWKPSRSELWNAVEAKCKRADSVVAREFELGLPYELSPELRNALAARFARHLADTYQIAVDVCIHGPSDRLDKDGEQISDQRNFHAHVLVSTNMLKPNGTFGNKARALDAVAHDRNKDTNGKANEVEELREIWADMQNEALAAAGFSDRVDRRDDEEKPRAARLEAGLGGSPWLGRARRNDSWANAELVIANPRFVLRLN